MAKVQGCDLSKIGKYGDTLDFYFWNGILCARMYPKKAKQPGTDAQKKTWEALKFANKRYKVITKTEREAWKFLASPSQMTGKDFFLKTILEEYQERGENYCHIWIEKGTSYSDTITLTLNKTKNAPVLFSGMTPRGKENLLSWEEITPTLRGKKFLRRWELRDKTERATYTELIPKSVSSKDITLFYDSGIRFVTAKAVSSREEGYGRAGLYII